MLRLLVVVALSLCTLGCPSTDGPCKSADECKKGYACCDGRCTDVDNDKANCGGCGVACSIPNSAPVCRVGRCQVQCTAGFGNCNMDRDDGCETDLTSTLSSCGLCGLTCMSSHATAVCSASLCGTGTCELGYANCDSDSTNGCEVDTRIDSAHCGGCRQPCMLPHASSSCQSSACAVTSCASPFGDCDAQAPNGCETDLTSSALHCGACGRACGPRQICVASECRATELIVFGGSMSFTSSVTTAELYRFDLVTNAFVALTPTAAAGTPPARTRHLAAWDAPRNRMLVWGGIDGAGTAVSPDVWALDFATEPPAWKKVSTSGTGPTSRFAPAWAVDASAHKLYVFGGTTEAGLPLSDFYVLDLATNAWSKLHDSNAMGAPTNRVNAMAAFDPVAKKVLLFGGADTNTRTDFTQLWQFDVTTQQWLTPPLDALGGGPPGRSRGAFFDGHPAWLFSGVQSLLMAPASMADDLRSVDVSASTPWAQVTGLSTTPPARFNAGATVRDGQLYVWAGGATTGTTQSLLSDLWRYDPASSTWTRLFDGTGTSPGARLSPTVVAR